MAQIALGLGSSHTPQLSTLPEIWPDHAERDRKNPELVARDGQIRDYDEIARHPEWTVDESALGGESWQTMYDRAQVALNTLSETLAASAIDAAVVIGDDQEEMFLDDGKPAFAIYWGDTVTEHAPTPEEQAEMPEGLRAALWAAHGDEPEIYPVPAELGRHLIEQLVTEEFDVHSLREPPGGRTLGHAFTFVRRRLMGETIIPILPIALNAYYPPNQPTPRRCYAFGEALRRAIESYPADLRVAVVASGGLSHFVVNQELDELVLDALARDDKEGLTTIPREHLRSGTSEIMNWIAAGAAMPHMAMKLVDYFPAYRSSAGTGVGMAFASWHPPE